MCEVSISEILSKNHKLWTVKCLSHWTNNLEPLTSGFSLPFNTGSADTAVIICVYLVQLQSVKVYDC